MKQPLTLKLGCVSTYTQLIQEVENISELIPIACILNVSLGYQTVAETGQLISFIFKLPPKGHFSTLWTLSEHMTEACVIISTTYTAT